jgi:hypothetical protein|tara:strand:- start:1114 stop:1686 length:573 start_codon:yes stop_codon:yes gene_type:complete
MNNFKNLDNLPIYDLYSELNKLIENKTIEWTKENQICINTTEQNPDNYLLGTGSLVLDWNNSKTITDEYGNESFEIPEYKVKYTEQDFSILCSQFKNTLFEDVYTQLCNKYKLGRVRLMKSKSKTCLSWHRDDSTRIHYPVKTQDGCFMVIENEIKYLELNNWYWTNTVLLHTAFNASKEDRIHLVAVIL